MQFQAQSKRVQKAEKQVVALAQCIGSKGLKCELSYIQMFR